MAARGTGRQGDRVRRIGVLQTADENDPLAKARISAFIQALADLGWTDDRNVRIDLRWGGGDTIGQERSRNRWRAQTRQREVIQIECGRPAGCR